MDTTQLSAQFQQWLLATPQALAKFLEVIKIWYENQGQVPPPTAGPGPQEFSPGGTPVMHTVGISDADLDALYHGYAQAIVKEKAIEYIKGFVTGVMFAAAAGA